MMKMKNKKWTALAVICFLIGVGIGLIGYHHFFKPQLAVYEGLTQGNTLTNWQITKIEPTNSHSAL